MRNCRICDTELRGSECRYGFCTPCELKRMLYRRGPSHNTVNRTHSGKRR